MCADNWALGSGISDLMGVGNVAAPGKLGTRVICELS